MIEHVLPIAHAVRLAHHTVVGALSTKSIPGVHTLPSTTPTPGLLNGSALGNFTGGSAYSGLSSITHGIDSVADDAAHFGDVFSLLGIIWGGLVHTHVFHNERAPEQSKSIVKGSIIGLGTMLAAPVLVAAISSI